MAGQLSYLSVGSLAVQARSPELNSSWMPAFHSISRLTMSSGGNILKSVTLLLSVWCILSGVLVYSHCLLFSPWCSWKSRKRRKQRQPYHHDCHPGHCCGHTAVCMCVRNLLYIPAQVERSELITLVGFIIILRLHVKTCVVIWKTVCQSLFHHAHLIVPRGV